MAGLVAKSASTTEVGDSVMKAFVKDEAWGFLGHVHQAPFTSS